MKQLILSYDYELFFGKESGTIWDTLIVPTQKLIALFDKKNIKATFFVDVLMMKYLRLETKTETTEAYNQIEEQLLELVQKGHRLELHLHPHWIDAVYNGNGTWDFSDFRHYSLNSLPESEILNLFEEGITYLNTLCRKVDPTYTVVAFRAGGWAIQPFSLLKNAFIQFGIKIDSSVAYGAYGKNQYSFFDFRHAPSDPFYRFDSNVLHKQLNGQFLEVPISSFRRNYFSRIIDKTHRILSSDLTPITNGTHKRDDLIIQNDIHSEYSMLTLSRISPLSVLLSVLLHPNDLIVIIDHPKDFSPSVVSSFRYLSMFVNFITYNILLK